MKKYFFKKALGWYVLFSALCVIVLLLWMFLTSAVSSIAPDSIARQALANARAYAATPVMTLIFLFAGKKLVQKIQNDGIYTGEYSRYTYFFYPLACAATTLITAIGSLVRSYFTPVSTPFEERTVAGEMVKSLIVLIIQLVLLILEFVVASKVIGSLLCSVTEGEESEERFFSKIGLPVCIGFAGALIIDFILIGLYDYNIITFAGNAIGFVLLAVMLLGLKYKFSDIKLRNTICNILPFVYVGIQAVTAGLKLFNALY